MTKLEASLVTGTYVDPAAGRTPTDEWITKWQASRLNQRPSTHARDDSVVRNLIVPAFEGTRLEQITPAMMRDWVNGLHRAGYAPSTIRKAYQLVAAAFDRAISDSMLPRSPCRDIDLPRLTEPHRRYLDVSDVWSLAETIDEQFRPLVLTLAFTGLRIGEAAALRPRDVDLADRKLTVARTLTETRGHLTFGEPKTKAARRTITIPATLVDVLADVDLTGDLVFTARNGGPIRFAAWRRRYWRRGVEASVGEPCRPHDLRHTHVAWCIKAGMHPRVISARLGHASIRTTLDVYGGLFPNYDADAIDALDATLAAPEPAKVTPIR